jgi:hypothetical protein
MLLLISYLLWYEIYKSEDVSIVNGVRFALIQVDYHTVQIFCHLFFSKLALFW